MLTRGFLTLMEGDEYRDKKGKVSGKSWILFTFSQVKEYEMKYTQVLACTVLLFSTACFEHLEYNSTGDTKSHVLC